MEKFNETMKEHLGELSDNKSVELRIKLTDLRIKSAKIKAMIDELKAIEFAYETDILLLERKLESKPLSSFTKLRKEIPKERNKHTPKEFTKKIKELSIQGYGTDDIYLILNKNVTKKAIVRIVYLTNAKRKLAEKFKTTLENVIYIKELYLKKDRDDPQLLKLAKEKTGLKGEIIYDIIKQIDANHL